ncbi:MAG: DUF285 domain-containing protein [archaeon]|nr:DUF285 domain-containing protein [archaeon]
MENFAYSLGENSSLFFYCDGCNQIPSVRLINDPERNEIMVKKECKCHKDPVIIPAEDYLSDLRGTNIINPEINDKCEAKECLRSILNGKDNSNDIAYYCKVCHLHICETCKKNHPTDHQVISIKKMFSDNDFQIFISICQIKSNELMEIKQQYKKIIDDLEQILAFMHSLVKCYRRTKNVLNYNIRNNLILNGNFQKIYDLKQRELSNIKVNPISLNIKKSINRRKTIETPESYFKAEYFIKEGDKEGSGNYPFNLFGNSFDELNDKNCVMSIDGVRVPFTKTFKSLKKSEEDKISGKHYIKVTLQPGFKLKTMKKMFEGCSSLTILNLSNLETDEVEDMSFMLYSCRNLSTVNLTNLNTSNTTTMHGMFSDCSSLTIINLSFFNTKKVEDMSWMFAACSNLAVLNLSGFSFDSVTTMSGMFSECYVLESLLLPNFERNGRDINVVKIFNGCYALDEKIKAKLE